jgi:O-antigen ligase
VVILNFTRIYFLALAVGGMFLLWRTPWKPWLRVMSLTIVLSSLIFFSTHFIASRGKSFGSELLGVRVTGIRPQTDVSAAIRVALLPDIFHHIKTRPFFGYGLGTEITYLDPLTHETKKRTQFDWGYFEMITELGIIGTIAYLILLITIVRNFAQKNLNSAIAHGFIAGALALAIVNITTPALFQGFGVLYFVFLTTISNHLQIHSNLT